MITLEIFQRRRQSLLNRMLPNSVALFFAALELIRSNDSEYPYRQNSNFWYLTGFNEPQSMLMLIKKNKNYSVLFNRRRDLTAENWSGRRLGQQEAIIQQGVDRSLPWDDLEKYFYQLLNDIDIVYHAQGENSEADKLVFSTMEKLRNNLNQKFKIPTTITDWRPWVHSMRLFKSEEEINILRHASKISSFAHTRAMQTCRPGMFEYQLEAEINYEFIRHGSRSPAYNSIVGAGENGCILHYNMNKDKMQDGDLVLVDAGCEFYGYASDITRTFPVNGKFSQPQREIYDIVLSSLYKALKMFRPGISIQNVSNEVSRIMIVGLMNLGILKGNINELFEKQAHRSFFMHGLSHWLGLDVHDVGHYNILSRNRILEPGMVLTVEPGLYISSRVNNIPEKYLGIGIRIEDNILITLDGNENFTENVVKNVSEIEKMMAIKT